MDITEEHRRRATLLASGSSSAPYGTAAADYLAAVQRIQMPGKYGEYAATEWATIEHGGDLVTVLVQHWEEGIEFKDDDLTKLAFDLLALRDLAATARANADSADGRDDEGL
jgi:hypothetical protein